MQGARHRLPWRRRADVVVLGEGEISYAGPNALARAKLARDLLRQRLAAAHLADDDPVGPEPHRGSQ